MEIRMLGVDWEWSWKQCPWKEGEGQIGQKKMNFNAASRKSSVHPWEAPKLGWPPRVVPTWQESQAFIPDTGGSLLPEGVWPWARWWGNSKRRCQLRAICWQYSKYWREEVLQSWRGILSSTSQCLLLTVILVQDDTRSLIQGGKKVNLNIDMLYLSYCFPKRSFLSHFWKYT